MTACLDEETVLLAALGQLGADGQASVDAHIDECASCRRLLLLCARAGVGEARTSVVETVADRAEPREELAIGARVDRYVVDGRLGAGAMGVVYAAHDPDLDRRVALKVLRDADHARLLREGRAVARLSHANAIAVHDVGVTDEHAFIVMELVDGESAGEWLRARRGWREVVALFRDAGRGLAAAHAAGLVHRDFKPANVLVGRDGRVKVGDFGLARGEGVRGSGLRPDDTGDAIATRTGALVGTPAYMAPEQLDGAPATAASDQFSFAVALWEGVYGVRPFAGATVGELRAAIARAAPVGDGDAPARVRAALVRALDEDPRARFGSMDALIAAIAPPARARRAWIVGGAALAIAAGVVITIVARGASASSACAMSSVGGAWDAARRAQVERAFARSDRPYAKDALAATERALDAYAASWVDADTASCEAGAGGSGESREAERACLGELRGELDGFTSLLATADGALVARAPIAAASLAAPATCADARARQRPRPPIDPTQRLAVAAQKSRLASARALFISGRFDDAARAIAPIRAAAAQLAWRPLEAEAALLDGKIDLQRGETVAADRALADSARAAEASRDDALAVDARMDRIAAITTGTADQARADELVRDAQAALDRLGPDPGRLATLFEYRGELASLAGRPAVAVAYHTLELGLRRAALPPDHDDTTTAIMDLARALDETGRVRQARALLDDALARRERAVGRSHPLVADLLTNRGVTFAEEGDLVHADADWQRALAIREASIAPDRTPIAVLLGNLGANARDERRFDDALALLRRSQAIYAARGRDADAARRGGDIAAVYLAERKCDDALTEIVAARVALAKAVGPEHPDVAELYGSEADIQLCRDRVDEALAAAQRALAIDQKVLGDGDLRTAFDWGQLGTVYAHQGDDARAVEAYRKALARKEELLAPDNIELSATLTNLADSLVDLHRAGEALPLFRRALAIDEKSYGPRSANLAFALRGIARASLAVGDRTAAKEAYARAMALDGFDDLGDLTVAIRKEAKAISAR